MNFERIAARVGTFTVQIGQLKRTTFNFRAYPFPVFINQEELLVGELGIDAISDDESVEINEDISDG